MQLIVASTTTALVPPAGCTSEIDRCVHHMSGADPFYMDFDLSIMLDFMRLLVPKLTDAHVRLIFNIA